MHTSFSHKRFGKLNDYIYAYNIYDSNLHLFYIYIRLLIAYKIRILT